MNRFDKVYTTKFNPLSFEQLAIAPAYLAKQHDELDKLGMQESLADSQRLSEDEKDVAQY